jgi:hypothetical protein
VNLTGVVGLAAQLAVGSPRSRRRFWLTAVGLAVAAVFLLGGAAALPLSEAQRDRAAERSPTLERGGARADGLVLTRQWTDVYVDRELTVTEVAAIRPDAPPPPGVERLPGPGEIVVSPPVREALRTDAVLRERYPQAVIGTVGDAGLSGPREWIVWLGAPLDAFPADHFAASGWGARPEDVPPLPGGLQLAVPVGLAALLIPLLALVINAVRWGSQERDRRLAALRLSGMSAAQVRLLTAVEVGLAGVTGSVAGAVVYLGLAAVLTRWLPGGGAFVADAMPPALAAVMIIVGLPLFATVTALGALRRVTINPMSVVRRTTAARPAMWRLLPLAAGVALAFWLLFADPAESDAAVLLLLAAALIMVGLLLSAPALCLGTAALLLRLGRGPVALLAARRAEASTESAARVVGVVTLLVFAAGWFLAVLPLADGGTASSLAQLQQRLKPHTLVAAVERAPEPGELDLPGVTGVAHLATLELGRPGDAYAGLNAVAGDCTALSSVFRTPLPECGSGTTYLSSSDGEANPLVDEGPLAAFRLGAESADGLEYVELGPVRLDKVVNGHLTELGEFGIGSGLVPSSAVPPEALRSASGHQVFVTVSSADPAVLERVRTAVELLQTGGVRQVRDVEAMIEEAQAASTTYRRVAWVGFVLAFVVSTLSLAVALLDRLVQERRGIASLRAQGVTIRTLRLMLLGQTATNLLPGVLLGVACTVLMTEAFLGVTDYPDLSTPWTQLAVTVAGCCLGVVGAVALMLPALDEAIDTRLLVVD